MALTPSLSRQVGIPCRRRGCPHPGFPHDLGWLGPRYCFDHGLRYVVWRVWRDRLERAELRAMGWQPQDELPDDVAGTLDVLFEVFVPGPFP